MEAILVTAYLNIKLFSLIGAGKGEKFGELIFNSKTAGLSHLDIAQLVKHYLGLRKFIAAEGGGRRGILLYLYWEPLNAQAIEGYVKHTAEIEMFQTATSGSEIEFKALSYPVLWDTWRTMPNLLEHADTLIKRYCVEC